MKARLYSAVIVKIQSTNHKAAANVNRPEILGSQTSTSIVVTATFFP